VVGAKNMPPAYFLHAPTPHIGAATVEAQKRIGQEIVEIIAAM
jgi:phosphoglycerate dehydrogenase-like enzyme